MTRPIKKMPTPAGLGVGQTAAVSLPLGMTYDALLIRARADLGAGTVDVPASRWGDVIDDVRLLVDGDSRIDIKAADLVALARYYGQTLVPGVMPLHLSRPWARTIGGEDQTSYGTAGGITALSLELDIKSELAGIDSLEVYAVQSAPTPFGAHLRVQRYVHNQGVVGEAEISDIVRAPYALMALHVTTPQIGRAEVLANQRKIHDSDRQIRAAHYGVRGRVMQPGYTHLDFTADDRLTSAVPMALQDFRLALNFAATGAFSIYAESIQGSGSA